MGGVQNGGGLTMCVTADATPPCVSSPAKCNNNNNNNNNNSNNNSSNNSGGSQKWRTNQRPWRLLTPPLVSSSRTRSRNGRRKEGEREREKKKRERERENGGPSSKAIKLLFLWPLALERTQRTPSTTTTTTTTTFFVVFFFPHGGCAADAHKGQRPRFFLF